jgi:hypothetical protein
MREAVILFQIILSVKVLENTVLIRQRLGFGEMSGRTIIAEC